MAITPNVLNFSYKKGTSLPPARIISYDAPEYLFENYSYEIESNVNWVYGSGFTSTSAKIHINTSANNLPIGNHKALVKLYLIENWGLLPDTEEISDNPDYGDDTPDTWKPKQRKTLVGEFTVNISISKAVILNVTPADLSFNYKLGGSVPSAINVNVTSENPWTVTENTNWLAVSKTSGSGNGNFRVSVIPNGINVGTHTANITISDGVTTTKLPVSLIISESETGVDYLYATPLNLNFGYTISGITPPTKRIELNSSNNWTASADKSWIKLSKTSAGKGVGVLDIGIHNLNNLSVGTYYASVSIRNGDVIKVVKVKLQVYVFAQETLQNDKLYFTDDYDNVIKVSSGRTDTHLQIKVSSNYNEYKEIIYNLPFFNGVAKKRIGLEAKRMIGDLPPTFNKTVSLFKPYIPIPLNFEINETELFADVNVQTINLQNIQFIKGTKVSLSKNWLSEQSQTIFCTKNGIVHFSFLGSKYVPVNTIKINGAITKTYTFNNSIEPFYTAIIPVTTLNLNVGDEITISVSNVDVNVVIKPEDKEQTFIYWENKWGCWDCFECTGEFVSSSNFKDNSFDFRKDFKIIETSVLEVKEREKYSVNTGYIYSDNEINSLREMLRSSNIYISHNNNLRKVKSTTKKLELFKTNNFLKSFTLTFENKEEL
ncbi:MAG: BACON domain-containing protein [Tenacibaculum sp.]|nr:BACON domain-containing protein [Tenacibaculum sp.]